ncbi:heterokaryon incompatibility protein [Diplodia corticola]|uniref:Heterokaryon incompatibility protein n=1 Tax=Diplodia corticola TaxID=236234 RepID=A0A1J9R052_9PEZI|nr:heterokaryon incompatibility protein [Diplodia corticola]OJD34008.1 heterokaryon incompatibility protein [Diplodia corticola]
MPERYSSPGVRSNASSQSSRDYQSLDPRDWRGFFVPGRIFMYQLHADERDYTGKKQRLSVPRASSKPVYRRCVVLRPGKDSSQCLCIKTYEGEGCTHKEVRSKQDRHAVVYTSDEPSRLREETNLRSPIQADPISHETAIPRLARLNYDSLFDFAHARPIYPLAQVTPRGLQTLLRDFEELNPPTVHPVTRKRTWDRMVEVLDATHLDSTTTDPAVAIAAPAHQRAPAVRPIRPTRRTSTFPPPIREASPPTPPPTTAITSPRIRIVAPRTSKPEEKEEEKGEGERPPHQQTNKKPNQPVTPFPQRHSPRATHIPLLLSSARDPRATAPVRALFDTACELNFIDPELALQRLGATALRYTAGAEQQPRVVILPGTGGATVPAAAEGMVKLRWRFQGGSTSNRSDVDTFVVFRGLPCEVVIGSRTAVERRWGVGGREAGVLGLPMLGLDERRGLEEDDRRKSEHRKRKEARENEEIERKFARERAALLGR